MNIMKNKYGQKLAKASMISGVLISVINLGMILLLVIGAIFSLVIK